MKFSNMMYIIGAGALAVGIATIMALYSRFEMDLSAYDINKQISEMYTYFFMLFVSLVSICLSIALNLWAKTLVNWDEEEAQKENLEHSETKSETL